MGEAVCKKCGDPIVWLKTRSGKNIPVEPESVRDTDEVYEKARHKCHFDVCPAGSTKGTPKQEHRPPAAKEPEPAPLPEIDVDDPGF